LPQKCIISPNRQQKQSNDLQQPCNEGKHDDTSSGPTYAYGQKPYKQMDQHHRSHHQRNI
jgi:hypothetical protein